MCGVEPIRTLTVNIDSAVSARISRACIEKTGASGVRPILWEYNRGQMKTSIELVGVLFIIAILVAIRFVPVESPTTRLLIAALVITIGGGTMAFL